MNTMQASKMDASIFFGGWIPKILFSLRERPHRHGQLRRELGIISQRMLTRTLRNLESAGFDRPQRDAIESDCCRIFIDPIGMDNHRSARRYVPMGKTIRQGGKR